MKKKIIKRIFEFLTFIFLMLTVFVGLKYGVYKDGNLDYYKKIGKTEKTILNN
jgi:hypothetical protein